MTDRKRDISSPVFSVVVPVFNRASIVRDTLDTIHGQTYRPMQLVIVDNGSTDNTRAVVEEWATAHRHEDFSVTVVGESTPGASAARNRGLREVTGDMMMFFDSDDRMYPDLAATVMEAFSRRPEMEMAVWPVLYRPYTGAPHKTHVNPARPIECHLIHSTLCTIAYAAKPELFRKAGGWNQDLRAWDDWELGVRILLRHPVTEYIGRPLCEAIGRQESITGENFHSKAGSWEASLDTVERVVSESVADTTIRDSLLRMVNYRRIILAAHYIREGYPQHARPLTARALHAPSVNPFHRIMLRIALRHTALGLRGAWLITGRFLR